jgi:hypothetical protein
MFVTGSNNSSGSDSSGRDEVASSPIQFVTGNYAIDTDEDEFGFEQARVRSSPSPNLMAAHPIFEARRDDDVSPCLIAECNTERTMRGAPSPGLPPTFASLTHVYPVAMKSKQLSHQLPLSSTAKPCTKQDRETSIVAPLPLTKTAKVAPVTSTQPSSSSIPMNSLLNSMTDVTQADQMTVVMEPATMRMEDSASQRTAVDGEDSDMGETYEYKPTKNEQDDIEVSFRPRTPGGLVSGVTDGSMFWRHSNSSGTFSKSSTIATVTSTADCKCGAPSRSRTSACSLLSSSWTLIVHLV